MDEPIADHAVGFAAITGAFAATGPVSEVGELVAFGHRVVHGGDYFAAPALVDTAVLDAIADCVPLALLHNLANLAGIVGAMAAHPAVANVAVFDTAFHQSMPPASFTYAIDREVARSERIRRYGFHGTSHAFVSRARWTSWDWTRSPRGSSRCIWERGQRLRGPRWPQPRHLDGPDPWRAWSWAPAAAIWIRRSCCTYSAKGRCRQTR